MTKNLISSFWQPCWKIFNWMPERVWQCARMIKDIWFFFQKNSQIDPMDTSKAVFITLPKSFCQKADCFSLISKNHEMTYQLTKKIHFLTGAPLDMWNSVLTILSEVFWQKREEIRSEIEKENKIHFFFKTKYSLKFSWGHVEFISYEQETFAHCPKRQKKHFFFKNFYWEQFYGDVKCSFFSPVGKNLPEGR